MEGHCSTGQCPQWAVVSMEEEGGRKQARKDVRDAHDFNNIETRAVVKFFFFFLQGKAPKEIHAILREKLTCFLTGRAKDLSALLYPAVFLVHFISAAVILLSYPGFNVPVVATV